jgi:peptide/nickel transport system substrate-binding protein
LSNIATETFIVPEHIYGEIDASCIVPAQIEDLAAAPVSVRPYAEGRAAYLGGIEPKVPDVRLRQALFFALDRGQIAKAAWLDESNYDLAYSILPPSNPFATTDLEKYDQNLDQAKALVEEADATIDLWLGGYIMGIDPDAYSLLFRSDASSNYFSYSNPQVDTLFDQGVAARDPAEREAVYDQVQAKLVSIYTFADFGLMTEK